MKPRGRSSGGSAAGGGFKFQAALGAIAGVHMLRGTPVHWTDGLSAAPPRSISFETSGPGDDISLELADGTSVEIQARKGLRADRHRFWPALDALSDGIAADRCSIGILIVCPASSGSVRRGYASALRRIGDGRNDDPSTEQAVLFDRLKERGYDPAAICARIRIKTVSALDDDGDAIAAARSELAHICADQRHVIPAWHALCRDALSAIANRGRRTVPSLSAHLSACEISLMDSLRDSPVAISQALLRRTLSRTKHFQVLGIPRPLSTDRAWLPLTASVRDPGAMERIAAAEEALADYHAVGKKSRSGHDLIDAKTLGTFRQLCVVIGGPGSGKSLLLRRLKREFAQDSYVSVDVRLRDLAKRIHEVGCAVEEGLFQLGLDGTGVSPEELRAASLRDLVLLCDGLDECGHYQDVIAAGLKDISESHPSYRVVVTTRPIGYTTTELHGWRHYELQPLDPDKTAEHIAIICRSAIERGTQDDEELVPRIRNYLEEGSATQLLTRSPLLLTFGAALFLNSKEASQTKFDLYQRIFRLIDDSRVPRKARIQPPEKAVRNAVLQQLGWLTAASPLLTSEELEKQCAQGLEQAIGGTYVQRLTAVQASIAYWEETGLVERLWHEGVDLIVFIHKTFGEFAAALHLSDMQPDEARMAIATSLRNPDWDEILDFATETSLATMLAELLVAEVEGAEPDQSILDRTLGVLGRPDIAPSLAARRSFLNRAFALARSEDRRTAYGVGRSLTEHDLRRLPEAEAMAVGLLAEPAEWSQLVGWGILACHFPDSSRRRDLERALNHFAERSREDDFFIQRSSQSPFGSHPDRSVFENFVIGALKSLLHGQDIEYQDRIVSRVSQLQSNVSWAFIGRSARLLTKLGRADLAGAWLALDGRWEMPNLSFAEFDKAFRALMTEVVPGAFLRETVDPLQTGPKYLAALYRLARVLDTPTPNIYVWVSEGEQLHSVHALLRAAAYVFELPTERLAAEATAVRSTVQSLRDNESLLDVLPYVDVGDIDWDRARDVDVAMDLLEGLIHHPSQWVQWLATILLDARLSDAERLSACGRLLETGTGNTLHFASALAMACPQQDAEELILARLGGRSVSGLHHLFDRLKDNDWHVAPTHLPILKNSLVSSDVETAVSAARWCQSTASSTGTWLVPLLRSATRYWLEHEDPYPEDGGVVPRSPREALLRTLCRIAPPTLEELTALAGDSRTDVANAAIDEILCVASDSADVRSQLAQYILDKRFAPRQCERLLDGSVTYATDELSALCALSRDAEPAYRKLALSHVLVHPSMDSEKAIAAALPMKTDRDGSVRDAAYEFLGVREESARVSPPVSVD